MYRCVTLFHFDTPHFKMYRYHFITYHFETYYFVSVLFCYWTVLYRTFVYQHPVLTWVVLYHRWGLSICNERYRNLRYLTKEGGVRNMSNIGLNFFPNPYPTFETLKYNLGLEIFNDRDHIRVHFRVYVHVHAT